MAGYRAAGMAEIPATFELFVRGCRPVGPTWSSPGWSRPSATSCGWRSSTEQVERCGGCRRSGRSIRRSSTGSPACGFSGDVWAVPEGTVVFAGRAARSGRGAAGPGPVGRDVPDRVAVLPDAGRVEGRAGRRGGAGPRGGRLRHAPRPRSPGRLPRGAGGVPGRVRRDEPRRGRAAARASRPSARWRTPGSRRSTTEAEAFAAYARTFPEATTLLVDTYDTARGRPPRRGDRAAGRRGPARQRRPRRAGPSRPARSSTRADRRAVKIFASGDLDEWRGRRAGRRRRADRRLRRRHRAGHQPRRAGDVDGLQARRLGGQGRMKRSPGKATYPLAKQVWRRRDDAAGSPATTITAADETAEGEAAPGPDRARAVELVAPVARLDEIRGTAGQQLRGAARCPHGVHARADYPVDLQRAPRGRGRAGWPRRREAAGPA